MWLTCQPPCERLSFRFSVGLSSHRGSGHGARLERVHGLLQRRVLTLTLTLPSRFSVGLSSHRGSGHGARLERVHGLLQRRVLRQRSDAQQLGPPRLLCHPHPPITRCVVRVWKAITSMHTKAAARLVLEVSAG
jgi:hypothetical protein